jgi:hypothetical protein
MSIKYFPEKSGAAPATQTTLGTVYGLTTNDGTGSTSLGYNSSAYDNSVAFGAGATAGDSMFQNTSATAIGHGTQAIGAYALGIGAEYTNAFGNFSVALGTSYSWAEEGITIGNTSLVGGAGTAGIAIGAFSNVQSGWGIAMGREAHVAETSDFSTAIGQQARIWSESADSIAIGRNSTVMFTCSNSIVMGSYAGVGLIGASAPFSAVIGTSARSESAFGIAIGYNASANGSYGNPNGYVENSIAIGTSASSDFNNSIAIGNTATTNSDNQIVLGNSSISSLQCAVQTISSLSDERDKTEIQPLNVGLDFINTLNPVKFEWNMRDGGKVGQKDFGFIAQELAAAEDAVELHEILGLTDRNDPEKLLASYGKLVPILVQAVKDLSNELNELKEKVNG